MKKASLTAVIMLMILSVLSGCAVLGSVKYNSEPEASSTVCGANVTVFPDSSDTDAEDAAVVSDITDEGQTTAVIESAAVESEQYTYSSDYIEVSIETPRITGLTDQTVQNSINAVFNEYAQSVKQTIDQYEEESRQLVEEGYATGMSYMIDVGYDVTYLDNGLLSLTLIYYEYTGGAHGNAILLAYTFDLATGQQLELSDLMPDTGYKSVVNGIIKDDIARLVESDELYELVEFEDIGDTAQWYLTTDGIVFYFQQYEYFPYAAGIQTFVVSYPELEKFFNDEYAGLLQ